MSWYSWIPLSHRQSHAPRFRWRVRDMDPHKCSEADWVLFETPTGQQWQASFRMSSRCVGIWARPKVAKLMQPVCILQFWAASVKKCPLELCKREPSRRIFFDRRLS